MTNKKSVPTFEGRLYTGEELHGLSGNWVRRAEVDALLDEVEQLRGNLSLAEEGLANYAKEVELLRDQRDTNLAKEVERIASLTTQRDEYKVLWERDSTALGKALNEVSSLRAGKEQFRAAIEQLHAAVKTAQELAARRLMEIERLARISLAARALLKYIDDHDWGLIPEGQTADTLRDLLKDEPTAHEPLERRSEETGWLIELAIKGVPHWLMVSSDREWTTDSNEALRFAREQDAEAMLYHSGLEGAKATGHTWCDPLPNRGFQETGLCTHGMPRALSECLPCVGGAQKSGERYWMCSCEPPGNFNIESVSICKDCGTVRPPTSRTNDGL